MCPVHNVSEGAGLNIRVFFHAFHEPQAKVDVQPRGTFSVDSGDKVPVPGEQGKPDRSSGIMRNRKKHHVDIFAVSNVQVPAAHGIPDFCQCFIQIRHGGGPHTLGKALSVGVLPGNGDPKAAEDETVTLAVPEAFVPPVDFSLELMSSGVCDCHVPELVGIPRVPAVKTVKVGPRIPSASFEIPAVVPEYLQFIGTAKWTLHSPSGIFTSKRT